MNSSSAVSGNTGMRSVENSGLHVRYDSRSISCSSKPHNRPVADSGQDAGSVVMKSELISNDELDPDHVLPTVNRVQVKQEVPEFSIEPQVDIADDLSVFDGDSLSEYEVSDSDEDGVNKTFDGFGDSETEVVHLNCDESNDRESFEGFKEITLANSLFKTEIVESESELESDSLPVTESVPTTAVEVEHYLDVDSAFTAVETNAFDLNIENPCHNFPIEVVSKDCCIPTHSVAVTTVSLTGNGSFTAESQLPGVATHDDCSFEGFHFDGIGNSDRDMNTSKFKSHYLFTNAILPELRNLQLRAETQVTPKQAVPKKTAVSPKQVRTVIKSEHELKEYIGPFCQAVGCTVLWLESGLQKNVIVNNGIVVELTEFAKKIAWERKYVAEWILRLHGFASNTVEVSEEDLKKIHMVNKRRKAISVTFSGKNLLKSKLNTFDQEIFTLPSESCASASIAQKAGSKQMYCSFSEKVNTTASQLLFNQAKEIACTATQEKYKHELVNSSSLPCSTNHIQLQSNVSLPCHKCSDLQPNLLQVTTTVPLPSFVEENCDSEQEMVIDETAFSNDEADGSESAKQKESISSPGFSSPDNSNDAQPRIKNTQYSSASPQASDDMGSVSGSLKNVSKSYESSTDICVRGNDQSNPCKKVDLSKSSFGQHIVFASKKGKGDFAGKNVLYPIFEIRENAIGPFCIRESLDVETLNSPLQKVSVTNGMIIELYIFFKERGATLTSLVYKLHQLMSLPINVTMMQSDMAKIQEVVNIELQKKTDYFLEKEFMFVIPQRHLNTADSSGTYPIACGKQDNSTKNIADGTILKFPVTDRDEGNGGSSAVVKTGKLTQDSNKVIPRSENTSGAPENSVTSSILTCKSNASHAPLSLPKPTQENAQLLSPLKTRSQVSNKHGSKKFDNKLPDSAEVILQDLNQCKGKQGCITRGDIVKLYYNWLQLKNEDKDSVFVIDLLSEVEKLMISREVDVIRIPVGTLMSSSVKLFEEYQRFRLSSQEDALAYLEDDWLEDIQYLVSISKTRHPKVEEQQPAFSKHAKVKEKPFVSKNLSPVAVAGQFLKNISRSIEDCVLDRQKDKINESSNILRRRNTSGDSKIRSLKKLELAVSDTTLCKDVDANLDQSLVSPEPVINLEEFTCLTFRYKIEMILSCRLSSTSDGPVYEYLIQWTNNQEIKKTWIAEADLPTAFIFITNFWENNPLRNLQVKKILQHRKAKAVEEVSEYLVVWKKYNSLSWIRDDHLPEESRSIVQCYFSTSDVAASINFQKENLLEGEDKLANLSPKTVKLTKSISLEKIADSAARNLHLGQSDRNDVNVSCLSSTKPLLSNKENRSTSVLPLEISLCTAASELPMREADLSNKEMHSSPSFDQQRDSLKKTVNVENGKQPTNEICSEENGSKVRNGSSAECENFDSYPVTNMEPDCTSVSGIKNCNTKDTRPKHNFSLTGTSMDVDVWDTTNMVQTSADEIADSTDSSSRLALTDDKENSSDGGKKRKALNRNCTQPLKRRSRDELLTEYEKSSEMTHFKKIPLSAVFGEKSKYKSLTAAIIQHVNPNYPTDNETGIEVLTNNEKSVRPKNAIVTKGCILAIYDEWRVARKKSNTDISVDNVSILRNKIKGALESCHYKYEYDDCLLGICYSLYLSRLKLETVGDILAFNNTDCINTLKHFKSKHSYLLTSFYSLPSSANMEEECNSEVSSTTDFTASDAAKGESSLSEAQNNLAGTVSALSQASAEKNHLCSAVAKLKQGISEIEKSIGNQPNNSAEVKSELKGMKQAVTFLEKGLSSNEKDVNKLQTQVDNAKALLSLKSSGMKDEDITDFLKLVDQSLPEASS